MPTKVRGQLKSIWPDRTQYKPYAYNLEMQNVFVDIEIPDDEVSSETLTNEKGETITGQILTLNGFTCLLGTIADSLDEMQELSLASKAKLRTQKNQSYFEDKLKGD